MNYDDLCFFSADFFETTGNPRFRIVALVIVEI